MMNRKTWITGFAMLGLLCADAAAVSTINDSDKYGYGANVGWINFQADTNNGVVIGESYCSGFAWGANIGWISLGTGPVNSVDYSNASANDFGVNHDGEGGLSGFAYGANVGWIAFETNGNPRLDLQNGNLSGYIYGANIGWISLSNSQALVSTDTMDKGPDTDGDGIADHWEIKMAGNLTVMDENSDLDGDGSKDVEEYLADTNPDNGSDYLRITEHGPASFPADQVDIAWPSRPTRQYTVEYNEDFKDGTPWTDGGMAKTLGDGGSITGNFPTATQPDRIYRVKGHVPLQ